MNNNCLPETNMVTSGSGDVGSQFYGKLYATKKTAHCIKSERKVCLRGSPDFEKTK